MTVHPIGPASALLSLSREELQERRLHPDLLTPLQTEKLAQECLSSLGRSVDCVLELESYPSEGGLLLFIHTAPAVWRFPDADALLDAVSALPLLAEFPLYRWQDTFWLVGEGGASLSEFADPIRDDPFLGVRLAEYARPLS